MAFIEDHGDFHSASSTAFGDHLCLRYDAVAW
ncbi:hypothetical protein ANO14919_144290 [Xylariales sp. No.14919]|nr:hypothetical protein ANO14919_144290 [Xylariales sp. No.14919]